MTPAISTSLVTTSQAANHTSAQEISACTLWPLAEQLGAYEKNLSMVAFAGIFVFALNRLLYHMEEYKFGNKPLSRLFRATVMIILLGSVCGFFAHLSRSALGACDQSLTFDIGKSIAQTCVTMASVFAVAYHVRLLTVTSADNDKIRNYKIMVYAVCVGVAFQAACQLVVTIWIHFGPKILLRLILAHYMLNVYKEYFTILLAIMIIPAAIIGVSSTSLKQKRYLASMCIPWAVAVIFLAVFSSYLVRSLYLQDHFVPNNLPLAVQHVMRAQLHAAPYFSSLIVATIYTLLKYVALLVLLGADSAESVVLESTFRWTKYVVTQQYSHYARYTEDNVTTCKNCEASIAAQ